jgi:O-antigen/teichoic acid export membrane protein
VRSIIFRYRSLNFALLDQAVSSGVNFLTIVILARKLGVEDFGVFMLAWLVLLFFKSLQGGIIISPMMSIGPKCDDADRDGYFGAVMVFQFALIAVGSLLILAGGTLAGVLLPDSPAGPLMLPVLAACAGDQLQEFARRSFFARDQAARAFAVDVATYGSRTLLLLFLLGDDSAEAFWFVFLSSMLGMMVALPGLAGMPLGFRPALSALPRQWRFARWTAGAALMEWGSGHLIVIVAGGILGPAAVGAIRATTSVFAPIQVLQQALNNVVPVRASALFAEHGKPALLHYLLRVSSVGGLACMVILVTGAAFPSEILQLLYGPDYTGYGYLVHWWIAIYVAGLLQFPIGTALCAVEFTKPFFISICCEAVFGILLAWFLPRWLGIDGVMLGILVTRALPVLVLGWFLNAWWRGAGRPSVSLQDSEDNLVKTR